MKKYIKKKIISIFIVIGLLISPITYSNSYASYAQWFSGKVIKYGSIMAFTGLTALLINHYSQKLNPLKDIITTDRNLLKESYEKLKNNLDYRNKTLRVIEEEIKKNQGKTINIKGKQVPIDKTLELIHKHINNLPKPNDNLDNYPPEIDKDNSPLIIKDKDNKNDNITSYPQEDLALPNYIYTPYGTKIDTSTEFPNDIIYNWQDYLSLIQDSQELKKDYVKERKIEDPDYELPDNVALHHLISANSPDTQDARDILEKYLGPITPTGKKTYNNAINAVPLPNIKNTDPNVPGILHNGRHPKNYNIKINQLIKDADSNGGWPAVQKELIRIKNVLQNAKRTDKWANLPL